MAHHLASRALPLYSCEFSRHDFTLPQLFACLVVKDQMKCSYRGVEILLHDGEHWCQDIGMSKVPDHNTLWRAANYLLRKCRVERMLDAMADWAAANRMLGLSVKPLALDSTYYESRHVSRHYERRKGQAKTTKKAGNSRRSATARKMPKLALAWGGFAFPRSAAAATWCCRCGPGRGWAPTTGTSRGCCATRGGACPTGASRRWPTPATTRSPPTASPEGTWGWRRSSRRRRAARARAGRRPRAAGGGG
jgi:hypothetical protein